MQEVSSSYSDEPKAQQIIAQLLVSPSTTPIFSYHQEILRYKSRLYIGTANNRNKHENTLPVGLLQLIPIPNQAWQHISMDFIEGLPKSEHKDVILVVFDRLTKYNHFIALQHPYTAITVDKAFLHNIFKLHGLPSSITSDRDKVFTSNFCFPTNITTSVAAVEEYLAHRKAMLDILKDSLSVAQARMKFFADQNRTDRSFKVGDSVYLKLQPYIQVSVSLRKNFKLSAKYYGPFTVIAKVGNLDYKLKLLPEARVHPVFHVSQLKKKIGFTYVPSPTLPLVDHAGQVIITPIFALSYRTITRGDHTVQQVLIHWFDAIAEEATWEDIATIQAHFPAFVLEDKDNLEG
ncbi:uncharacterized protein LOC113312532 [Papaver somniferum]|uniref:uncharacterized protein LOC113312532 n=1 Tax=Papaver somniferum TaxID=3469 RepID=UPI000E703CC3|nr:uncharacterized protein LOC113312532 [Papaver somniferum]